MRTITPRRRRLRLLYALRWPWELGYTTGWNNGIETAVHDIEFLLAANGTKSIATADLHALIAKLQRELLA
ncbi:hypothetical protein [Kribbella albertanoniae]|uniref:Uncharacterized protein n=1 Tax=Kribbella albertanoniae TaxID=1266829 RepID=A0A4R4QEU7_9ACTN|nr:hypothetical protein [Kribbella albertanoniae]TDC34038.1 hypothetical protein E1261_04855 [Kribbella albertanoniae]